MLESGERVRFDLLGLYKGVFLMRDRATGSVWAHLDGFASQGPLAGQRLDFVSLPQMTWGEWRQSHPDTLVLDANTPWSANYGDPGQFSDPTLAKFADNRLPWDALVVGVEANSAYMGFPLAALTGVGGYTNTTVGGVPVLVTYDAATQTGIAHSRVVEGQALDFSLAPGFFGRLTLQDAQTGSKWDASGTAIEGPLSGTQLTFVPSFISAWYGWSAYHPQTDLFDG